MLNEQLNDLYRNNLGNLREMYSVLDGQKIFHYVGPLLIYCWEERYLSSKYRLMTELSHIRKLKELRKLRS